MIEMHAQTPRVTAANETIGKQCQRKFFCALHIAKNHNDKTGPNRAVTQAQCTFYTVSAAPKPNRTPLQCTALPRLRAPAITPIQQREYRQQQS